MSEQQETEPVDFEAALKELEDLVARMEKGDLSLEESLKSFERGVTLTRHCQKALQEAEQKVEALLADREQPTAFREDGDGDD